MLEGHVLRELLAPDFKSTSFFTFHEIFHGVTAPGFLFGAGFTFAIATQRRWEESVFFSSGTFRRLWRAMVLVLIGYALHMPFLSLYKTLTTANGMQWSAFFMFDVLQCIGICLLTMRLMLVLVKREKCFMASLLALLLLVVYASPMLWTAQIQHTMPLLLSSAINGLSGSPFPLFPNAGFLYAGTLVSWIFLRAGQGENQELFMKRLMGSGLLLIAFGALLEFLPGQWYDQNNFWSTSPNYFWIRLGILMAMLGVLWYAEDFISIHRKSFIWMPKWLTILGVESLFVYILHLILLCGWITNTEINLRGWWGGTLNPFKATLVFLGLTMVMIPCSLLWRYLKKSHPKLMRGIYWWMGFCIAWSFLFNPY